MCFCEIVMAVLTEIKVFFPLYISVCVLLTNNYLSALLRFFKWKKTKEVLISHTDSVQLKLIIRVTVREQYILERNGRYQHFKEAFTGIAHRRLKHHWRSTQGRQKPDLETYCKRVITVILKNKKYKKYKKVQFCFWGLVSGRITCWMISFIWYSCFTLSRQIFGYFVRMMSFLYRLFKYFEKGPTLTVVKCAFVPCKGPLTTLFIIHYWNTFHFVLFQVLCMLHQASDLFLLFLGQFIQIIYLIF